MKIKITTGKELEKVDVIVVPVFENETFKGIFKEYPGVENFFEKNDLIHTILFNGALAEAQFKRHVTKLDTTTNRTFEFHRLPSTSPAMAMLNLSEKIEAWSILVEKLKIRPHN